MNKAFVRESDGEDDEALQPALRIPAGARNYITPAGHARLKDELEHLVKRERPHVVEIVAWAASNGDRSENGDYIYGKRRLREIDRRIRFLSKRLDIAEVVDPLRQGDNDQVFFGATVTIGEADGSEHTYRIVGIDEADASAGRISWISPLARALIKSREGDSIRFQSPVGVREIDILEVRYETIA
ncbi:transcription elongation factor GreB [Azonexus fungiphilus]|jgi:transcription elongation factor GreB|uniref:Transcription elongation factor GreB n=1 Tax=Azonexus fungiphilus TaxID=146940 RepID=A0A495WDF8_9RHOO|nr:transcription elongation factor GreB [Azonexus fungiphilus]NHC05858.1 transcription elongation factor GreB [Azonexus fungiphilus]RKT59234.1 transcription elongation factor GreB [Azonexus fungiphilus]